METIPEFEEYLDILTTELLIVSALKREIRCELQQALNEKYNELLIKGYAPADGISLTLADFENPKYLALRFNKVYNQHFYMTKIARALALTKASVVAALIRIFMLI